MPFLKCKQAYRIVIKNTIIIVKEPCRNKKEATNMIMNVNHIICVKDGYLLVLFVLTNLRICGPEAKVYSTCSEQRRN